MTEEVSMSAALPRSENADRRSAASLTTGVLLEKRSPEVPLAQW
jgi:hypothetical protein